MSELTDKQIVEVDANGTHDDNTNVLSTNSPADPLTVVPAAPPGIPSNGGEKAPSLLNDSASTEALSGTAHDNNLKKRREDMLAKARWQKIGQWAIFTITIALLPILLNGLYIYSS